ncbi:MAG: phosphomethylpyrimidine synthase ThiC [Candidatus Omnitrophota bacterium]
MTQLSVSRNKTITPLMKKTAEYEGVEPEFIRKGIEDGNIVIPSNAKRTLKNPRAVGKGLKTKINANIGTSFNQVNLKEEILKLETALKYGADAVMDLSTGGNIAEIRSALIKDCTVPFGTVPIYEAAIKAVNKKKAIVKMDIDDILEAIKNQAEDGVDFMTIHAGLTLFAVERLKGEKRILDVVSRGGAFLVTWMIANKKENPFYEYFDEILKIAYKYDITLSLGDGLRPGSILDGTDRAQVQELIILGELADKARNKDVQVIIEGPGHVRMDEIEANIILQKKLCKEAPFYVLGPLVTDIVPGYDHIVGAIGGAIAAGHGADFLCYVTPSEHLRLPSVEDVKAGVMASRIAAHAADIVKGVKGAIALDEQMSKARKKRDWDKQIALSLDGDKTLCLRKSSKPDEEDVCTMCGKYCAIKVVDEYLR